MTEEEGMEVDVHTPDKALPGIKMKEIVLNSLQKKTQAKSNVLEKPPHGSSMCNQISCSMHVLQHASKDPLKGMKLCSFISHELIMSMYMTS